MIVLRRKLQGNKILMDSLFIILTTTQRQQNEIVIVNINLQCVTGIFRGGGVRVGPYRVRVGPNLFEGPSESDSDRLGLGPSPSQWAARTVRLGPESELGQTRTFA